MQKHILFFAVSPSRHAPLLIRRRLNISFANNIYIFFSIISIFSLSLSIGGRYLLCWWMLRCTCIAFSMSLILLLLSFKKIDKVKTTKYFDWRLINQGNTMYNHQPILSVPLTLTPQSVYLTIGGDPHYRPRAITIKRWYRRAFSVFFFNWIFIYNFEMQRESSGGHGKTSNRCCDAVANRVWLCSIFQQQQERKKNTKQ